MVIRFGTPVSTPIYAGLVEEVEVLGHVHELCEHGMSLDLCEGPQHYMMDRDEMNGCPF